MKPIRTLLPALAVLAAAACREAPTEQARAPEAPAHTLTASATLSASPQYLSSPGTSTVTATSVTPAGSYAYRWLDEICTDLGGGELDCIRAEPFASGIDLTQVSVSVGQDEVHKIRLVLLQNGVTKGEGRITIYGP
jgi:hypothetical protein